MKIVRRADELRPGDTVEDVLRGSALARGPFTIQTVEQNPARPGDAGRTSVLLVGIKLDGSPVRIHTWSGEEFMVSRRQWPEGRTDKDWRALIAHQAGHVVELGVHAADDQLRELRDLIDFWELGKPMTKVKQ